LAVRYHNIFEASQSADLFTVSAKNQDSKYLVFVGYLNIPVIIDYA
jgi:hypothetical protein